MRRLVGVILGTTGLAIIASASAYPPMLGCPPSVADPAVFGLGPSLAVDYCAGTEPAKSATDLFILLNAVGVVSFLGGLTLLTFRQLVNLSASSA